MDDERFDRLTRTLATSRSRRVTLGGLAAGILLGLGLALDETTLLAKKNKGKGKGKRKGRKKKNPHPAPVPEPTPVGGCPRPGDSRLHTNQCPGDPPLCTNVLVDHDNCGGCSTASAPMSCSPGQQCVEGTCVSGDAANSSCTEFIEGFGCGLDAVVCCAEPTGSRCRNLHSDTNHCGACQRACTAGKTPACCWGRCRDLHADPLNCGACFTRCPTSTPICYGGQCHATCDASLTRCGNTCLHPPVETCCSGTVVATEDLQHDATNCGGCGKDCAALSTSVRPPRCCGGVCCDVNAPACCSGECTNISLNDEHCGECGNACRTGETCRFGACA